MEVRLHGLHHLPHSFSSSTAEAAASLPQSAGPVTILFDSLRCDERPEAGSCAVVALCHDALHVAIHATVRDRHSAVAVPCWTPFRGCGRGLVQGGGGASRLLWMGNMQTHRAIHFRRPPRSQHSLLILARATPPPTTSQLSIPGKC